MIKNKNIQSYFVFCLCCCFMPQPTIFQSCPDIFLPSWVEPVLKAEGKVSCLMTQHSASGESQTSDTSTPSLTLLPLSHCALSPTCF